MPIAKSIKVIFVFFFLFFYRQELCCMQCIEATKAVGFFNKLEIGNVLIPVKLKWGNFGNSVYIKAPKKFFDVIGVFIKDKKLIINFNENSDDFFVIPSDAEIIVNCGILNSITVGNYSTLDCGNITTYENLFITVINHGSILIDKLRAARLDVLAKNDAEINMKKCFVWETISMDLADHSNVFIHDLRSKNLTFNSINNYSECDISIAEVALWLRSYVCKHSTLNVNFSEKLERLSLGVFSDSNVNLSSINVSNMFAIRGYYNSNITVSGKTFIHDATMSGGCTYDATELRAERAEIHSNTSSVVKIIDKSDCDIFTMHDRFSKILGTTGLDLL